MAATENQALEGNDIHEETAGESETKNESRKDRNEYSIPVQKGDSLSALDKNATGTVTLDDVRRSIRQLHTLRKIAVLLSVVVIVLLCGMFGAAYAAVETAKELKVKEGQLIDSSGEGVATHQRTKEVVGLNDVERRLDINLDMGPHTHMSANVTLCEDMWKDYTEKKKAHFVVAPFASGQMRSVSIESAIMDDDSYHYMSGVVGSCVGYFWWLAQFDELSCAVLILDSPEDAAGRRMGHLSHSTGDYRPARDLVDRRLKRLGDNVKSGLDDTLGGPARALQGVDKCSS
eukprot:CAMPEP_0170571224 /NCGR_PEP_ID=MMETSP0224-20130122/1550_1 /TAXON_ID=285029 /ORGANISM="Togula jolla, Strain CCCM 725" /LENGTH=288 /DNA_ID=CAMNT_0010893595 /DNA_START=45 /DNA_END=911 /DNA_ORIENTATION=+